MHWALGQVVEFADAGRGLVWVQGLCGNGRAVKLHRQRADGADAHRAKGHDVPPKSFFGRSRAKLRQLPLRVTRPLSIVQTATVPWPECSGREHKATRSGWDAAALPRHGRPHPPHRIRPGLPLRPVRALDRRSPAVPSVSFGRGRVSWRSCDGRCSLRRARQEGRLEAVPARRVSGRLRLAGAAARLAEVAVRLSRLHPAVEPALCRDRGRGLALPDAAGRDDADLRARLDRLGARAQRRPGGAVLRRLSPAALHPQGPGQRVQVQPEVAGCRQPDLPVPPPDFRQHALDAGERRADLDRLRGRDALGVRQRLHFLDDVGRAPGLAGPC